jgi:hypothetical protein
LDRLTTDRENCEQAVESQCERPAKVNPATVWGLAGALGGFGHCHFPVPHLCLTTDERFELPNRSVMMTDND